MAVTAMAATWTWLFGAVACGPGNTDALAQRLVSLLHRHDRQTVAAHDPSDPQRIIAAMRLGRSQLIVAAGVPDVPGVAAWLREGRHDAVYRVLTSVPVPKDGYVLYDLNGLGLRSQRDPGEAFDMFHPFEGVQVAFDGDWQAQRLTAASYCDTFSRVDDQYRMALTALLSAVPKAAR
jgi:hypothetical protein